MTLERGCLLAPPEYSIVVVFKLYSTEEPNKCAKSTVSGVCPAQDPEAMSRNGAIFFGPEVPAPPAGFAMPASNSSTEL